jgi:heme-degrading monooxygenase HmoA
MIARVWRGRATHEDAPQYVDHLERSVFPRLEVIDGHEGAILLRHVDREGVEFVVLTMWRSLESARRFAGDPPVLAAFDERVHHYELKLPRTTGSPGPR